MNDVTTKGDSIGPAVLKKLMRDLLPQVRVDQLVNSYSVPAQALLKNMRKMGDIPDAELEKLPHVFWAKIRENYSDATSFPLGTVAERAVKRFLGAFTRSAKGVAGSMPNGSTKKRKLSFVLADFTTLWLFEAAMMNLRGFSSSLSDDFGFWYHWKEDGSLRTLSEEAQMRKRLLDQCQESASRLISIWAKEEPKGRSFPLPKSIISAFTKEFDVNLQPPIEWVMKNAKRPITVLGHKPDIRPDQPANEIAFNHKLITVQGKRANVRLVDEELLKNCGGEIHSMLRDLLEIAALVYISDIYLRRDSLFARDLVYLIPVRHPKVWQEQADALSRIVSFLSYNTAEFCFVRGDGEAFTRKDFRVERGGESAVALFSGGLDSFVGATELLKKAPKSYFVSHCPTPLLISIQSKLAKALCSKYPDLVHVKVPVTAARKPLPKLDQLGPAPPQVLYQYTRSFLFLALAACLALEKGIAEIYIHENGPIALNPSFAEARFNTRTTHPIFIRYFSDLIRETFGVELQFINPYILKTKGEMVELLEEEWHSEVKNTNSCWAYSNVKAWAKSLKADGFKGAHCGRCLPCIWRRASIEKAGLRKKDDDEYLWDHIKKDNWGKWLNREHFTVLIDQLRLCENALTRPKEPFLDLCPDFYDGEDQIEEKIKMYKRFSSDIVNWFKGHSDEISYSLP